MVGCGIYSLDNLNKKKIIFKLYLEKKFTHENKRDRIESIFKIQLRNFHF